MSYKTDATSDRLLVLDVMRGIALFGILYVNLFSFGADSIAWSSPIDQASWHFKYIFFESKFWGLYSILFGMGFFLFTQSKSSSISKSLRRFGILFVFGCFHALFFDGDILMLYAELALLMLVLFRLPTKYLIVAIFFLCLSFPVGHFFHPDRDADLQPESVAQAKDWLIEDSTDDIYASDTLIEIMGYHFQYIPEQFWADYQYPDSGFVVLGLFLVGYLLARTGVWRVDHSFCRMMTRNVIIFWMLGSLMMVAERYLSLKTGYSAYYYSQASPWITLLGDTIYLAGTLLLISAWFFTIQWWVAIKAQPRLLTLLAQAGQMSLTLYLTQSLIFTSIFYGYGLGYAYTLGPTHVLILAIVIYIGQLALAAVWLRYFKRGPLEWIWRLGIYLRFETIRRN